MTEANGDFFTAVQKCLDEMGEAVTLSADEQDVVDDYERQEFGAKECAAHIAKGRATTPSN